MTTKLTSHKLLSLLLLALLSACGTVVPSSTSTLTPAPSPTSAPTATAILTETPLPPYIYTVVKGDTCTSIADAFNVPVKAIIERNNLSSSCPLEPGFRLLIPYPSGATPRPSPTPSLTPTPLSRFSLAGYIMIFVDQDSDLYFQDGDNLPVKLTHIGELATYPLLSSNPGISSDNKKILFYRGDGDENVPYTINTDGTNEQIVIPNEWLNSFGSGTKNMVFGFIPDTHSLLFETYLCQPQEPNYPCSARLFIADTDTTQINKLADFDFSYYNPFYNRNIQVSPNGKLIAVGNITGLDIFTIDGKTVRKHILPYKPAREGELPLLFWLPDSSGLLIALPDKIYESHAYDHIIAYSVWRYSIDGDTTDQIPMEIPPMASKIEFSPDRKWGIYGGFGDAERSLYLADLTTGNVQVFGEDGQPSFSWGPDSKRFSFGTALQNMSTVDNPFSAIQICSIVKWIDINHFTCIIDTSPYRLRLAEIDGENIKMYALGLDDLKKIRAVLIKPK